MKAITDREFERMFQQASAWRKICYLLDTLSPGWEERPGSGIECATAAIRALSVPAVERAEGTSDR